MPVISLRYTPSDLAPIRAYAQSRGVPLSSAIKQLAGEALQAKQKPVGSFAEADRRLLRQAATILTRRPVTGFVGRLRPCMP